MIFLIEKDIVDGSAIYIGVLQSILNVSKPQE